MDENTTKKPDVVEIANKQRYASLIRKMNSGKALTQREIKELAKYETQKNKDEGKGKGKSKKPAKAKAEVLTPKQEAFCREYLACNRNGAKAYEKIYKCSAKAAESGASRSIRIAKVAKRIEELEGPAIAKAETTIERLYGELGNIAHSNIIDFVKFSKDGISAADFTKLPREFTACISEISEFETANGLKRIKFKLHDKLKAIELLGRSTKFKMFEDTINHKLPDGCGVLVVPQGADPKAWEQNAKDQQKKKPEQDV